VVPSEILNKSRESYPDMIIDDTESVALPNCKKPNLWSGDKKAYSGLETEKLEQWNLDGRSYQLNYQKLKVI